MLRAVVAAFRTEDRGQDLAECCLLTALVALVGLGLIIHFSGGLQAVWNSANATLVAGSTASNSSQPTTSTTSSGAH